MKLFYKPGACSMATHIVLHELHAPIELESVDTNAGITESGAAYRDINPRGYVPALILDNGETLTENSAILQYLFDEHFGDKISISALSRSRLQEALSFLSSELHKAFSPFFAKPELTPEERANAHTALRKQLGNLEELIADGRKFILGAVYTPADAYAFVILNWTNFINFSLDDWPKVKSLYKRILTRPATQKALYREGLIKKAAA